MKHPRAELHASLLTPVRLSLLAALLEVEQSDFKKVCEVLEVTDAVLSKNMRVLEESGLIAIRKGYVGNRPRTWLSATRKGRSAYQAHRTALLQILKAEG